MFLNHPRDTIDYLCLETNCSIERIYILTQGMLKKVKIIVVQEVI